MRGSVVAAVLSLLLAIGVARVPTALAEDGPREATAAVASSPPDAQERCAALLDVVVLVAIISIEVGLLLPAVQEIREAAARCSAN